MNLNKKNKVKNIYVLSDRYASFSSNDTNAESSKVDLKARSQYYEL